MNIFAKIFGKSKAKRGYDAGRVSRVTSDWRSNGISIDSLMRGDLPLLRTRSRQLQEENEYAQKFLTMVKTNVLGTEGLSLKNKASDPPIIVRGELKLGPIDKLANLVVEMHWWEWSKKENCTVAKDMTWKQVQDLALETCAVDGETLFRFVIGEEANNHYNFAIQPISTDRLDHIKDGVLPNGNTVKMGVEKDQKGAVVAYWICDADPTEFGYQAKGIGSNRYPASEFVHARLIRRIGQSRGIPWMAPGMMRLRMLKGMDDATLHRARASACKMGFITSEGGQEYEGEPATTGGKFMEAEPGSIEQLPPGMDVKFNDWNAPSEYGPFVNVTLRGLASALSVSYPNLANDYASVNFSSGRMARLEEVELWKHLQSWFASDFCSPIFAKWLEVALTSNALKVVLANGKEVKLSIGRFAKYNQPTWHGRRWSWLDPEKEVSAKILEINSGFTSISKVLSELGIDRDEHFQEIKDDREAIEKYGILLPEIYENALSRFDQAQGMTLAEANKNSLTTDTVNANDNANGNSQEN